MRRTTAERGLPGVLPSLYHIVYRGTCIPPPGRPRGHDPVRRLRYRPVVPMTEDPGPRLRDRPSILLVVAAHLVASLAAAMLLVVLAVAAFDASGPAGVAILTVVQLVPTLVVIPLVSRANTGQARRRALLASQVTGV